MDAQQMELYRKLGYKGHLPITDTEEALSFAAPGSAAAPRHMEAAERARDVAELPLLELDDLQQLKAQLDTDPEAVLTWARGAWDAEFTEEQLRATIEDAQAALRSPDSFSRVMDAATAHEVAFAISVGAPRGAVHLVPPGFTFPGMTDDIPIDPSIKKFETQRDRTGWLLFAGVDWLRTQLGVSQKAPFRWHNHPTHQQRRFVYDLEEPTAEAPLEVALVSDFGTGLYPSLYIAAQLRQKQFPYAIHLGDVYYAGRRSEFQENFEAPLNPILQNTRLFMLNANHEMMSGAYPYFGYIDAKKAAHPHTQKQEGSYFCLRSSRFQLVGIDTDYHRHSRLQEPELVEWLGEVLREGKREGRTNILLSSNEPYEYGHAEFTPLLTEDLAGFAHEQLIDLWFWGNTHYCAFFDAGPHTPFIGSCIGHGGYPYSKVSSGKRSPAVVRFLETLARFPAWTELAQGRGNNGYCVLRLKADGSVDLNYIDWMSTLRCEATLSKPNRQNGLTITDAQIHDR
jgi:hypothetical protein